MWNSIYSKIKKRIADLPDDAVFTVSDFSDLAEPKTVSKSLTRMEDRNYVTKIMRGIFCKNAAAAQPDTVARALARSNCWQLVPCGSTAMHLIGATEEAPEVWTYVTDGTNREYKYGNIIIRFKHASGKFLKSMSDKSALLVQVLKAWGQKPLTRELTDKILSYFHKSEYQRIIEETRNTTVWVFKAVCSLFGKKGTKVPE